MAGERSLFVGVDGGGTKTAVAVVDSAGAPVGDTTGGPSSYRSIGVGAAAAEIVSLVRRAVPALGRVERLLAAVSDVDTRADQSLLRAAIEAELKANSCDGVAVDVANDAIAALASGGERLGRGIACIAGTGSVALGLDGRGSEARAGGWGPPFGDGGSGYWIGFQAIARALHRFDRGERDAILIRSLLERSGCRTLPELLFGNVGASEESESASVYRGRVAALAPAVERAALDGDRDALEVFTGAGAELARLIEHIAARLSFGDERLDIVQVGSLWNTRVVGLGASFRAATMAAIPNARLGRPTRTPALGAALLARLVSERGQLAPSGLLPE
ncbi:MAG: hypothetical protein EPO26_15200 [Chloroflexota bacterium]|nr:MAG: hypothetical protein EPO26_15200 [Chloroflexota bacterium]